MARNNSSPVQQFRGTTAQHAKYTGRPGELTVDTDKNVVVVHDGVTAGGHPMASSAIFSGTAPGLVPTSTAEETGKVLRSDGLWNNTSLDTISEKAQALGNTTGNKAIDVSKGAYITCTITGNTTFSFTSVPQTGATVVVMQLTNGGAYTITWPSSIKWSGGTAPEFTASGIDIVVLTTNDAGATWYGIVNLAYA